MVLEVHRRVLPVCTLDETVHRLNHIMTGISTGAAGWWRCREILNRAREQPQTQDVSSAICCCPACIQGLLKDWLVRLLVLAETRVHGAHSHGPTLNERCAKIHPPPRRKIWTEKLIT